MNVAELLQRHPVSRGLSAAQVHELVPCARLVSFPEGAVVFRAGDDAEALYLILAGRIALEQHVPGRGDVQLENLGTGDLLGLSWLFPNGRWLLDAQAVEETTTLALDAKGVQARMEADPALGFTFAKYVIQQLYQRLERVRLQRLDVYRGDK